MGPLFFTMAQKEEVTKFSGIIDKLVKDKNISYMDAILHHCERTGFEIEGAAKMISTSIKAKIKKEAQTLNFIEKSE
jgi:hypothetical protein